MRKFLLAVSALYVAYGIFMLSFVASRIIEVLKVGSSDPSFSILSAQGVPILTLGLIGIALASLACWQGYLLFQLKRRKTSIVISCLLLVGFPYGTILGVITLCLLQVTEIKNEYVR